MSEQLRSFLQAIREAPEDDAPRLVLADWLEDHGDPQRAEFVRVQVRLAGDLPDVARRALQAREAELFAANAGRWLGPLAQQPWEASFRRGTARVKVQTSRLLRPDVQKQAEQWFPSALVTDLRAQGTTKRWGDFAALPLLEGVSGLVLSGSKAKQANVVMLAKSRRLRNLRHLGVRDALSQYPDDWLRQPGMEALVESPHLRGLTRLDFSRFPLDGAAQTLLMTGSPWRLTALTLDGSVFYGGLGQATWLPGLKELSLYACMAWEESVVKVVRELAPARLRSLCLGNNRMGDATAEAVAGAPHLAELRELWLTYSTLTERGARALADSPYLANLRLLHLHSMPADSTAGAILRDRFGDVARFEPLMRD